MSRVFLATTALAETWDFNSNKICFLGEWCKIFSNKDHNKFSESYNIPYLWNNEREIDNGISYCLKLYDKIICTLSGRLNKYHKVNHKTTYWNILLRSWLVEYIMVMYDRYSTIKFAYNMYDDLYSTILDINQYSHIFKPYDFVSLVTKSDTYNFQLYSQVISFLKLDSKVVKIDTSTNNYFDSTTRLSVFKTIFYKIVFFLNRLFCKKIILVVNPYFKSNKIYSMLKLFIKSKFLFVFDDMNYNINQNYHFDLIKRVNIFTEGSIDEFENFIYYSFVYNFPIVYLEQYKNLVHFVDKIYTRKPDVIYSTNSFHHNEIYKFYIAQNFDSVFIAYGQHGGNIGIDKVNIPELIETEGCHVYYTYGWTSNGCKPLLQPLPKKYTHNNCEINLIMNCMPRYFYRFAYQHMSTKILDYVENTKKFLLYCKYNPVIRLYKDDFDWHIKDRLLTIGKELRFNNSINYYKQISSSRLNVFDHMHTGFMESMQLNKPTIIFIADDVFCFREDIKEYIDRMKRANILFYDSKEAAEFINKNYKNIEEWWNSDKVQKVREDFCYNYARASKNWADEWIIEFDNILEEQCKNKA